MKNYIIYCHTNKTNGKKYIGYTSKSMEKRWQEHINLAINGAKYAFPSAIRKYGPDMFDHKILSDGIQDHKQAQEMEKFFIQKFDSYHNGYNETMGGDGGATMTGKKHKPETIEKMREWNIKNSPTRGRKLSKEEIEKHISKIRGMKRSKEFSEKLSKERKGSGNPNAKLNWDKVLLIRELLGSGELTQEEIAKQFGIATTIISRIKNNKIWKI